MVASRNRVTLVKPGATTGQGYEEHELDYCYGPEATSNDIYRRTLEPIVRRVVDGVNATVLTLGSTGSGKTHTLEGAPTAATGEEGVIVRAVKGLFEMLHTKARSEGERTSASGTRVGREYEYEVETHFVEILEEKCRDLYAPTTDGSAGTQLALCYGDCHELKLCDCPVGSFRAPGELACSTCPVPAGCDLPL